MTRILSWAVVIVLASPLVARAQRNTDVRYRVTPYGWLAGLDGQVGVGPVSTDVDLSVSDILKALKFVAMANGEMHVKRYAFGLDAIYLSIGGGDVVAFRGDTGSLQLTQQETIVQPVVGYMFGDETLGIDVLAGARYWNLRSELDVDRPRASNVRSASRDWVDATGGLRVRLSSDVLQLVGGGDGGGGGSHNTWQAYGSIGAILSTHWVGALGYRSLWVDYDRHNFLFDTATHGFTVTFTYGF